MSRQLCPSTTSYLTTASLMPVLSAADELRLATQYRDTNDLDAAKQLVFAHLRFVIFIANSFAGYGLPKEDLIQEGNVGLMKAVKRFDPDKGVRLVYFAAHWIRAEIQEYIQRNWRIVRMSTTKDQRKLFFNLRRLRSTTDFLGHEETKAIAANLSVPEKSVVEAEQYMMGRGADISYDPTPDTGEYEVTNDPAMKLGDDRYNPERLTQQADEENKNSAALRKALSTLSPREREVIEVRYFTDKKETLNSVADRLGITGERVRQIEKAAIQKLRELV